MHPELVAQQGVSALEVATTIKLTRALWIVVLALVTPFFFRKQLAAADGATKPWYSCVPRFIPNRSLRFLCVVRQREIL